MLLGHHFDVMSSLLIDTVVLVNIQFRTTNNVCLGLLEGIKVLKEIKTEINVHCHYV